MQFMPDLVRAIAERRKTQTRRPVKLGQSLGSREGVVCVQSSHYTVEKKVGGIYAVQPGRGKLCVLWRASTGDVLFQNDPLYKKLRDDMAYRPDERAPIGEGYDFLKLRILDIRREDVRHISEQDAIAEGFRSTAEFLATWCSLYMPRLETFVDVTGEVTWTDAYRGTFSSRIVDFGDWLLENRPRPIFDAWVYTFEAISE